MDAIDDMEISGGLVSQLQDGLSFCRRNAKKMWYKTPDGRVELPDYPEECILEGLVNGLIHRSYLEIGSEVHIDIFDDRIEIFSPGGMFESKPIQEYDIIHVQSRRRNPILADIFSRLHYMERRGSGFKKICLDYSSQPNFKEELKPKFFSDDKDFVLTLYNLNYGSRLEIEPKDENNQFPKVPQKQIKLPDYLNVFASILKDFPGATIPQLAQEAQLSERMIKKDLRALKEFGIIERVGSNRKGYWKFRV